ncbi:tail assembly protein [Burkholderia contaminans FFH2055]|uniref:phage tail assembly chaperone n=1 Tax=Burkholderia contaminans TaxID=488447 RepID=UPI00062580B0|nr:phage tail assembly chaperone [Burkholderia contaminans]KKL33987.1 tail assembly protein [Burkholderia contaminans FFH2055]MEB4632171.1 phage tail protein [Burkholderia contaminans]MEB4639680.1 phage tail protein [Burkholderia contaminans]MEB4654336.1 phage tail protein [Burkholderia contaminans]MEB4663375.1 phage tail protein [Burkholderia contaminans]
MTGNATAAAVLRAAILNPLAGWRHEMVLMPEWGGVTVAVREPLLEDRAFWLEPLRLAAGVEPGDDEDTARAKYAGLGADVHKAAYARLFVRVLFVDTPDGWQRQFEDDGVNAVARAFSATHERVINKALELARIDVDPDGDGKNPSAETPSSDSK